MTEQFAEINGTKICYEVFGDPTTRPILLVMGLGAQMISWDIEFCKQLVHHDFYVIRFDNRDVGLSTKFEEAGVPNVMKAVMAIQRGKTVEAPYTLDDMADDAVGLLDFLNIDKAHICGASMGGMIVQTIAIRHPNRVLSLTSIMSTTSDPDLPQPEQEAMQVLLTPAPPEREAFIKESVKKWRVLYGSGFPYDEERQRKIATMVYDRSFYPDGFSRQLLAILASGNRKSALAFVNVPTLVIHGGDDPLVPVEGGKDTANSIPGSELMIIDGMGHSLPPETWSKIIDAIAKNAAKVNI